MTTAADSTSGTKLDSNTESHSTVVLKLQSWIESLKSRTISSCWLLSMTQTDYLVCGWCRINIQGFYSSRMFYPCFRRSMFDVITNYTEEHLQKRSHIRAGLLKSKLNTRSMYTCSIITLFCYYFFNELQSSDMQFGFKRGHSTTLCSLIYKEVVNHY